MVSSKQSILIFKRMMLLFIALISWLYCSGIRVLELIYRQYLWIIPLRHKDISQKNRCCYQKNCHDIVTSFSLRARFEIQRFLIRRLRKSFWYTKLRFGCHEVTSDWRDWHPNKVCIYATMSNKGYAFDYILLDQSQCGRESRRCQATCFSNPW